MSDGSDLEFEPSTDQRRIAAQQYEHARQAINTGNYDYGIELLQSCCKLDPANLIYRKTLRATEKTKYKNNMRGGFLSSVSTGPQKAKLKSAKQSRSYYRVLEHGEAILARNPWDTGAQLDMAQAADALGMLDIAVWILEQARQRDPKDASVNRPLAELYERQGNYQNAIALWDLVAKSNASDHEAAKRAKDLAATSTIVKGNYQEAADNATSGNELRPPTREFLLHGKNGKDGEGGTALQNALERQIEPLRKKIELDPLNPNPYLQIASIYEKVEQHENARKVLQEALAATGHNVDVQMRLAELEIEHLQRNLNVLAQRLQAKPDDERFQGLHARYVKEIEQREMAMIRQRADRFPTDLSHRIELGVRLRKAGQMEEAIQELQHARKDPRQKGRALLELGRCFSARKNWSLARRNYVEALQNLASDQEDERKEVLLQLATIAAAQEDWATAVEFGTELADIDYGYHDVGKLLDVWQERARTTRVATSEE